MYSNQSDNGKCHGISIISRVYDLCLFYKYLYWRFFVILLINTDFHTLYYIDLLIQIRT